MRTALSFATAAILAIASHAGAATIIYVDASATGANDGSSWTSAFNDLQDALALAADLAGDPDPPSDIQLWIAAGTYKPGTPEAGPEATFNLVSGAALYGGFAGSEESLDERDWEKNETVLSGLLGTIEGATVRAYSVVTAVDLGNLATLDGLTVTLGGGVWPDVAEHGGGLRSVNSNLVIRNATVAGNTAWVGAGAHITGGSTILINSSVSNNWADTHTGGLHAINAAIEFADSIVADNFGSWDAVGVWIDGGSLLVTNTVMTGNSSPDFAATAIRINDAAAEIVDCLIHNNPGNDAFGHATILGHNSTLHLRQTEVVDNGFYCIYATSSDVVIEATTIGNCDYGVTGSGTLHIHGSEITHHYYTGISWAGDGSIADSLIAFNKGGIFGGGITWGGSNANLTISSSIIQGNVGMSSGGISFGGKSITVSNTAISNNKHDLFHPTAAGALRLGADAHAIVVNSTIKDNFSYGLAGAMHIADGGSAFIANSILWNNWGDDGPGSPQIHGDADVAFSIVESDAPWPGEGNLNDDPLFADADGRLSPDSPAIDAGDNGFVPRNIDTDLDGNPRIVDGTGDGVAVVDMGAFEFQSPRPTVPGDLNGDGVVDVFDLLILLGAWGECEPNGCPADLNGDGVVNVFDLLILLENWT